ncbi:tetratricopeptide repeat protein [Soonwooa sp.]|uniref:type IX secretion system periplasmic lipoprotein PorW/SprE n=1 Tax=Soonwooa sp. TaxID=1938592 RepID=UPI0028AC4A06|nr:tetratricopeptide repeat protein [Soonwooa sp.]
MRKFAFIILSIFVVVGCTPRKKKTKSGPMNRFSTYYNTMFNSKEAFNTEMQNRTKSFKDNFYEAYIPILTTEDVATEVSNFGAGNPMTNMSGNKGPASPNANSTMGGGPSRPSTSGKGASILQIAEAKALKTISKNSVLVNGVEKNSYMFDAYMLLAKSRMYQGKNHEALDALNYIFNNMPKHKRINTARIYQAEIYAKLKDYQKADRLFVELKDEKLNKEEKRTLSIFYSEMLLKWGKKNDAVTELEEAFEYNKVRKTRSRIAYLRGQILAELGKKQEARESFTTAYKYAYDFEFEVKTQIQIAKTFDNTNDNYDEALAYLEKIAKKGTYASRKNELYYAMGLLALNAKQDKDADSLFRKSISAKVSDPQIRGLAFSEIGKKYFAQDDYLTAGAYYDSALAVMTYAPEKARLTELTTNIKKLSKNYYLIKKNDSILALTKMSKEQQEAYFAKHIDKLKAKEAAEEIERKRVERSKGFDTGDYNANSMFANSGAGTFGDINMAGDNKSTFYFANTNNIPRGETNFKQIWGNRTLADNWRYSAKSQTIEDLKNEALGVTTAPDPRRFEPSFYTEKIPSNSSDIAKLKKDRDTASLGLGIMFENFFSNSKLATKTLYDLVDGQPDEDTELKALYQAFVINYEKNPGAEERAKTMILEKYPYTSYAEFVKNPRDKNFNKSSEDVQKKYEEAYKLYDEGKYQASSELILKTIDENKKDALVPKLYLLNAYNAGKSAGKEIMILQLEQIVLNYANTMEGDKAKQLLKYLKSDIKLEMTDGEGKKIAPTEPQKVNNAPNPDEEKSIKMRSIEATPRPGRPGINQTEGPPKPKMQAISPDAADASIQQLKSEK